MFWYKVGKKPKQNAYNSAFCWDSMCVTDRQGRLVPQDYKQKLLSGIVVIQDIAHLNSESALGMLDGTSDSPRLQISEF